MNDLKIMPKDALAKWVNRLISQSYRVVGPIEKQGLFIFSEIQSADELIIDYTITTLSPKKYLLPPREELFSFNTKTLEMQAHIEVQPTVIIGLHACDMHAIQLLDKVNNTGYADQHYQARRQATYLVSVECLAPCSPESFCKSMNTLSVPDNFDLHMVDLGSEYAIQTGTDKGEELLEGCINVWSATDEDYKRINAVLAHKWEQFDYRIDVDVSQLPEVLGKSMNSPIWNELGEICLACGMCTQVCPTCYCFDVDDEVDLTLEKGARVRTWDSCQIDKFAIVAGGHDFRSKRAARQRHRFLRKGKWQFEAYGLMGCVGCGRCALACLVGITPIKTFNMLGEIQKATSEEPKKEEEYA